MNAHNERNPKHDEQLMADIHTRLFAYTEWTSLCVPTKLPSPLIEFDVDQFYGFNLSLNSRTH